MEQFGKAMRIPDAQLGQWYRLVMDEGDVAAGDPLEASSRLRGSSSRVPGEAAAQEAEAHFTRVVREGRAPDEVPEAALPDGDPVHLPSLLVDELGIGTTSAARRLIEQGGVRVDGEVVKALDLPRKQLRGAPPGREAPLRAVSSGVAIPLLPCPRRLARGCMKPAIDTGDPSSQRDTTYVSPSTRAFGVNGGFFCPQQRVWSLKTQQRETSRLFGWSLVDELKSS